MRYMLLMYRDEKRWEERPEPERDGIRQQAVEFSEGLRQHGVYEAGDPLQPIRTAATIRLSNGKPLRTDGPFAETKEQLGGYSIVEADSLDEVIAIVARHPLMLVGGHSIEIRPIREMARS
jgi:hypothetical protein